MPLTDALVAQLVECCGPYLYHDTKLQPLSSIIDDRRLRPPTEKERIAENAAKLRPRPNAVYFRLPVPRPAAEHRPKAVKASPFRVPLESIDPELFLLDEDRVCDWLMGWDKLPLPAFSSTFRKMPVSLCETAGILEPVRMSRGEWVDAADKDTPENVWASALRGTVAVRGAVSLGVEANLAHGMVAMLPNLAAAAATTCAGWTPLSDVVS